MEFLLEGFVGDRYYRRTLGDGTYVVGRGSQSGVHLVHRSVSREHAQISIGDKGFSVEDSGSRNGTFINDRRVGSAAEAAKIGDRVRFGAIELNVLSPDSPMTASGSLPRMHSGDDSQLAKTRISWDDLSDQSPDQGVLFRAVTEAAPLLVQPRPLEELFEAVLEIVDKMVPSRRKLVLLENPETKELEVKAARPARQDGEELMLSASMTRTVLEERSALLVSDAMADDRFAAQESIVAFNVRSALVAPLFDNEHVIGLIYVDHDDPLVRYDEDQLRAFTLLANLIAIKITQTKLLEEQREKERLAEEMATAQKIQVGLLPENLPDADGYAIFAKQMSCFETAGDLYDVAALPDGSLMIVVGDVSGKGLGAALLMSNVMAGLRVLYEESNDLARVVSRLNDQLQASTEMTRFVTLFVGRLDPKMHELTYVNAGHNAPFLITLDKKVEEIEATGIPVGMMPGAAFEVGTVKIPDHALLAIFTDGIPEAQVGEEFYDEERLIQSIKNRMTKPVREIGQGILDDLFEFLGDTDANDDITLMILGRRAERDPERTVPG